MNTNTSKKIIYLSMPVLNILSESIEKLEKSQKQLDKNFKKFESVVENGIKARNSR